jgi:hypothetical protein
VISPDAPGADDPGRHPALVPALAAASGALAMTAVLGPGTIHPENIDWLMRGDFSLHFLGWHLYRSGPWTLPIGATPLLIWPIGSSVGLTDSIPLASVVFKLLDPILPPVFQFIGIWLVLCVALQGAFGALLMQVATARPVLQFLGAVLLMLSPPLLFRFGHAALMAHWVLLAALWLCVKDGAGRPAHRYAGAWALLAAATAAIQPYLLLMVAVLMTAAFARQAIVAPRRIGLIAAHTLLGIGAAWTALWQSGSLMVGTEAGLSIGGFGVYSANLLTFAMPTEGWTLLSPGPIQYASPFQYEGYAYLGAGVLLLAGVVVPTRLWAIMRAPRPARPWQYVPLALALLFLAAMAAGPTVTAGPRTLLTYDVNWWGPFLAFRTHARMIWPVYYAVVLAILFGASRLRYPVAAALLALAVLVQAVDLVGMARYVGQVGVWGYRDPLNSRFWRVVPRHYERLVLFPSNVCDRDGRVDYLPFALLAGRHGLAINAGATARYDVRRAAAYCDAVNREVSDGLTPAAGSLYIVRPDLMPRVAPQVTARGGMCTTIDGYGVCFSTDSYRAWQGAFAIEAYTPER